MKISIVTPSLNQADFLPKTMQSILSQVGDFELESIVMDGGSTDGSLDALRQINDPRMTWTSGPDDGQSDAINQGLARASGDIIAWLNSDDLYEPGALAAVARAFAARPDAAWLTGSCVIVDEHNRETRASVRRYKDRRLRRYRYRRLLQENFISQPATFWRRDAFAKTGELDRGLHWAMDYDLWLRLGQISDPIVLDRPLARFRLYNTSKTGDFSRRQYDEDYDVAIRYMPGNKLPRITRRLHTEKIVLAYRLMKLSGR